MSKLYFGNKILSLANKLLAGCGWKLLPICPVYEDNKGYIENDEVGCKNFVEKVARVNAGESFEWPNMVALNQVVANFIGNAKNIVSVGAGTGTFEWHASVDSNIKFVASEFDQECVRWCEKNRQRDNIIYCAKTMEQLLDDYGRFDLAVAVDVIEHIKDYAVFLKKISKLSDRAIITTPNKARNEEALYTNPPAYYQHIREWTAGEFYWILRMFYSNVQLYSMPDIYVPRAEKIGLLSAMTPLIGVCEGSLA